jgi:hypothetical protein
MVAGKASAQLVLNVSGSAVVQKSFSPGTAASTGTYSFSEKTVFFIITNALANAATASGGALTNVTVPAGSYIAFDPNDSDNGPEQGAGFFYITNKAGFYLPLSGFDANDQYYSYIELDTQNQLFEYQGFEFGFVNDIQNGAPFEGVSAYNISSKGSGTETDRSTSLLYIHDDPYSYDDADNTYIYFANTYDQSNSDAVGHNSYAIEIRGLIKGTLKFASGNFTGQSYSQTGTGNFINQNIPNGFANGAVIQNATVTLK